MPEHPDTTDALEQDIRRLAQAAIAASEMTTVPAQVGRPRGAMRDRRVLSVAAAVCVTMLLGTIAVARVGRDDGTDIFMAPRRRRARRSGTAARSRARPSPRPRPSPRGSTRAPFRRLVRIS